jgi:hypothetical protein
MFEANKQTHVERGDDPFERFEAGCVLTPLDPRDDGVADAGAVRVLAVTGRASPGEL